MKKNVLFIAPTFFGYYKEIVKSLEKKGNNVDYICDIPSSSNVYKAISRVKRKWTKGIVNKYFSKKVIPLITDKQYDYIFIIAGMTFSLFPEMIEKMRKQQSNAKFIMYQWDGEENINFVKELHKYFDKVYTFDRNDAINNKKYNFLPLFYTNVYKKIGKKENNKYEYDVFYVGTAHPQKLKYITEMSKKLEKIYKKQYIYNYMPSILKFYYHKLTAKEYKGVKKKELHFEKMQTNQIIEYLEKTKCILDAPQKGQNGLTIRTIECLGAKRKLITTNQDIVNYDFYCPENIYVYNGEFDYNSIFFKTNYKDIDDEIYKKYLLDNWLDIILN